MQRLTIRRFDVLKTASVVAAMYFVLFAVFGLIFLVPFALVGIAGSSANGSGSGAAFGAGLVGGLLIYVFVILFYTFIGWVATIILLAFYNFVAGRMGGIRFVVDVEGQAGGSPGYPVQAPYGGGYATQPQVPWGPGPGAPGQGTPPAPHADPPGYGAPPAPPA
jgi:hypothetical protein